MSLFRRKVKVLGDSGSRGCKARMELLIGFFHWEWSLGFITFTSRGGLYWTDSDGKKAYTQDSIALTEAIIQHRKIALEEFYQITGQRP